MQAYAVTLLQALSPKACDQLPDQSQSLPCRDVLRLVERVKIDLEQKYGQLHVLEDTPFEMSGCDRLTALSMSY